MTKPTDDTVARMLGVTQAHEVPATYGPCDRRTSPFGMHCVRPAGHDGNCTGLIMETPEVQAAMAPAEAPTLNRDATVAVSPTYTYNEDMSQAPRGVKLILLGASGVAVLTEYNGKNTFWVGWAALPRRAGGGA